MSSRENHSVDLIEELRLRQWARRNFVPLKQRCPSWHPIVLAEMSFRDQELAENPPGWTHIRTPFVPLAPTDLTYLDEAHPGVPSPSGLLSPREAMISVPAQCDDDERIGGF
jgi:hypothetical protein